MWCTMFQSLDTLELQEVGVIHKPDFVAHPERYFTESSAGKRSSTDTVLPSLPNVTDSKYVPLTAGGWDGLVCFLRF